MSSYWQVAIKDDQVFHCVKCGSWPILTGRNDMVNVICGKCGVNSELRPTIDEAIDAWNVKQVTVDLTSLAQKHELAVEVAESKRIQWERGVEKRIQWERRVDNLKRVESWLKGEREVIEKEEKALYDPCVHCGELPMLHVRNNSCGKRYKCICTKCSASSDSSSIKGVAIVLWSLQNKKKKDSRKGFMADGYVPHALHGTDKETEKPNTFHLGTKEGVLRYEELSRCDGGDGRIILCVRLVDSHTVK